jgi:hypothetical protein
MKKAKDNKNNIPGTQKVDIPGGDIFKNSVLVAMSVPGAVPMVCLWWDGNSQAWCSSVENSVRDNVDIKKQVGEMLFVLMGQYGLFDAMSKNKSKD